MRNVEKVGLTTRKPKNRCEVMLNAIRDSLSNLACCNDGKDVEDKNDNDEDPELGKLSEVDEPGWVMVTISKVIYYPMEMSRQMLT